MIGRNWSYSFFRHKAGNKSFCHWNRDFICPYYIIQRHAIPSWNLPEVFQEGCSPIFPSVLLCHLSGFAADKMVSDRATNILCIFTGRNSSTVVSTGNARVLGFIPRRTCSLVHWVKALIFWLIAGNKRIFPCEIVKMEHILSASLISSFEISLQIVKSYMDIGVAKNIASTRFKPHAVMALLKVKVTGKVEATAAIFFNGETG